MGAIARVSDFFGMQLSEVLITLSRLRAEWYSKTGSPGEITRVRT